MSLFQKFFTSIALFLICCIFAVAALIATPFWFPQLRPGSEFLVAVAVLLTSFGLVGYFMLYIQINALKKNLATLSAYSLALTEQLPIGSRSVMSHPGTPGSADLASTPQAAEELAEPDLLPAGVQNQARTERRADMATMTATRAISSPASPFGNDPTSRSPAPAITSAQVAFEQQAKASSPTTASTQSASRAPLAINKLRQQGSKGQAELFSNHDVIPYQDDLLSLRGPQLIWLFNSIASVPARKPSHYWLDLLIVSEEGFRYQLQQASTISVNEAEMVKKSLLFAIQKLITINSERTGLVFLPLPTQLAEDAPFIRQIQALMRSEQAISTARTNSIIFCLPQSIFAKQQLAGTSNSILDLANQGYWFAIIGDGETPTNPSQYTEYKINFFLLDGKLQQYDPETEHGSRNFSSLVDQLQAFAIELIAINVDSEKRLLSYLEYPVNFAQGSTIAVPEVISLLKTRA